MAKCGCAGQGGSVVFEDTPSVEITGAGTPQNPYRIDVRQLYLETFDTATIDMVLSGTGSETDPYVVSANFIGTIQPPDWQTSEMQNWAGAVDLTGVTGPRTIRATLTGDVVSVALPVWSSAESGSITLMVSQDAVGGWTWVMPGTSALGIKVALTPAPNARDLITLFWTGIQWVVVPSALDVK